MISYISIRLQFFSWDWDYCLLLMLIRTEIIGESLLELIFYIMNLVRLVLVNRFLNKFWGRAILKFYSFQLIVIWFQKSSVLDTQKVEQLQRKSANIIKFIQVMTDIQKIFLNFVPCKNWIIPFMRKKDISCKDGRLSDS